MLGREKKKHKICIKTVYVMWKIMMSIEWRFFLVSLIMMFLDLMIVVLLLLDMIKKNIHALVKQPLPSQTYIHLTVLCVEVKSQASQSLSPIKFWNFAELLLPQAKFCSLRLQLFFFASVSFLFLILDFCGKPCSNATR